MAGINANTVLMLHGNGDLVDSSPSAHTVSAGGAAVSSSTQKEFGSGSLYSPGSTGSGFSVPNSADFNIIGADCGVDFWFRLEGTPATTRTIIGLVSGTGNSDPDISWCLYTDPNRKINLLIDDTSDVERVALISTTALSLSTWYHVAVGCKSGRYDLYINGVSEANVSPGAFTPRSPAWTLKIGYGFGEADGDRISGYWDELRIQKGECDYASGVTFTPPTDEYTASDDVSYSSSLQLPSPNSVGRYLPLGNFSAAIHIPVVEASSSLTTHIDGAFFENAGGSLNLPVLQVHAAIDIPVGYSASLRLPAVKRGTESSLMKGSAFSAALKLPFFAFDGKSYAGQAFSAALILPALFSESTETGPMEFSAALVLPGLSAQSFLQQILPESFAGILVNLHTMTISTYDGFNFNSMCKFNGQYLGANNAGISILDGDTDAGAEIDFDVVSGLTDNGIEFKKRSIYAAIAGASEIGVILSLFTDDGMGELACDPVYDTDKTMHTIKVKPPKGRLGRYWTFRVQNISGGHVDLDRIAVTQEITTRRV